MGLKWTALIRLGTDYGYDQAQLGPWFLEVQTEPNNLGDYEWKAHNCNVRGVTEVFGASPTITGAKRLAIFTVGLLGPVAKS